MCVCECVCVCGCFACVSVGVLHVSVMRVHLCGTPVHVLCFYGLMPTDVVMCLSLCLFLSDKSFPRPVVTPRDQVVLKNEEAVFHCQFTAVPEPTVEWYYDTELLTNKSR